MYPALSGPRFIASIRTQGGAPQGGACPGLWTSRPFRAPGYSWLAAIRNQGRGARGEKGAACSELKEPCDALGSRIIDHRSSIIDHRSSNNEQRTKDEG